MAALKRSDLWRTQLAPGLTHALQGGGSTMKRRPKPPMASRPRIQAHRDRRPIQSGLMEKTAWVG